MGLETSFAVLSDIAECYECWGHCVRNVEAWSEGDSHAIRAQIEVEASVCSAAGGTRDGLSLDEASMTDDGRFSLELSPSLPDTPPSPSGVVVDRDESLTVKDDDLLLIVNLSIRPEENASESDPLSVAELEDEIDDTERMQETNVDDGETAYERIRDESLPPYEDTDYLQALYDSCETFEEMSDRIEMDVSSETVRRYMIEAGVHTPSSYSSTSGSGKTGNREADSADGLHLEDPMETIQSEKLVTDGVGLPGDLTIEEIADAVVESRSAYQVAKRLDLDQNETREILRQFNLLDLVFHRVSASPEQETTYQTVAARIKQCSPGGA